MLKVCVKLILLIYALTHHQTLHSRNHLDWMRDLETRLKMKNVNQNIMSIAIAKNVLLENIMELADREVDGTQTCECDVFVRG